LRWLWLEPLGRKARRTVTVQGTIVGYEEEDQDESGAHHQVFIVEVESVTPAPGRSGLAPGQRLYVVIRYGDSQGLEEAIPGIAEGKPVEVQGVYVTPEEAYDQGDGLQLGVIHFTHRPVGWVKFEGRRYA